MLKSRFLSLPLKALHSLGPNCFEPLFPLFISQSSHSSQTVLLTLLQTYLALSSFRALAQIPLSSTLSLEAQHSAQDH